MSEPAAASSAHPDARPLVIAHRGASGYRPEHTESAYRLALALGAEAIEPDVVATRDGELVLRHENEISGTTDVADHTEFADRRTTREIDGERITGWFTEDFTWAELSTLRARERLPQVRPASARFDGRFGLLRLRDLQRLIDEAPPAPGTGRPVRLVVEVKHATYFAGRGLPLDELVEAELRGWGQRGQLVVEAFEQTVLGQLRARGLPAEYVYLLEKSGSAADLVARHGAAAISYAGQLTDAGLGRIAAAGIDGVSVDTALLVKAEPRGAGQPGSPWTPVGNGIAASDLVDRARAAGLATYTWTLRAENRFLPAPCRIGASAAAPGDWMTFFQAVMRTGLDGVFADQPDLALEARAAL
ncbi:glycerophosphodiester phosphodiesterase family protein [Microcella sp.]|uniref:glycerophosphodiester phosphodiesterase family protein n=1 Tax=Microcella sp. TaxID=1913979 RepID=UPI002565F214|nr:glycerophosphodiester phosphodiesterase family protein [Microcella sp.]MBX9471803.1 glycerophosphodiester phosphodiesterase [Microcella sp.]